MEILSFKFGSYRPIRVALCDDNIYFVCRDLYRVKGVKNTIEKYGDFIYRKITDKNWTSTVKLISSDNLAKIMCQVDNLDEFNKWIKSTVLPKIYKHPKGAKFIPVPPWKNPRLMIKEKPSYFNDCDTNKYVKDWVSIKILFDKKLDTSDVIEEFSRILNATVENPQSDRYLLNFSIVPIDEQRGKI